MPERIRKYLDFEWIGLTAAGFLLAFGLLAIYSLSLGNNNTAVTNFERQIIFLAIGVVLFIFFSFIDYRVWKSYSGFFYLLGIILLVAVLFFGKNVRGTSGWFSLGFFNFQPVELMKIFLIISLANYFSKNTLPTVSLKQLSTSFLYVLVPVILAIKQPDMGAAMVMIAIWLGIIFLAGLKKKYIFMLIVIGILIPLLSWNLVLKDYQRARVTSFFNPEGDPLGSGYNVIQSMVAVGSGGMWGKGLGHGSQSQLNFLPEKHTDFIFAAIAEESGFIGAGLVLALFWILLYRLKKIADKSKDSFGSLLVAGIIVMIFFQMAVNIGMNLGIMPIAGLSLPFISYGGSFLIVTLIALGLSQSVWKKRRKGGIIFSEQ